MIKAIAFDPGKTTGFATGEIISGDMRLDAKPGLDLPRVMLVQTAQAKMTHADIFNWLNEYKPDYIICERFDFRNRARTGLELISRELIGVVNLYTGLNTNCALVMQTASQGKGHWTNDKLKAAHLYRKGQDHANDACRHLLYWYRFGSGAQYGKEFKLK